MEGIHSAVRRGNDGEVTRLLDGDPTLLERRDDKGETPLMVAAEHGQLGVMRLLLQRGANINATERYCGRTALHYAARAGHVEVASCLLGTGAETNSRDIWDRTPLMLACEKGRVVVVQMLVQHLGGLQGLDERNMIGMTALRYAAEAGHGKVVAFLLGKGAQASTRDNNSVTPLMSACGDGHLKVVRMLLQHTGAEGIDARDRNKGWTALHGAAFWGREEMVRFLLLAGADPTVTDNKGRTAHEVATPALDEYTEDNEEWRDGRTRCVAMFKWWEGELERRYVLSRATCLHKAYTTQRDQPTSQVPTYVEARVAAGHAVPVVEVVSPQSQEQQHDEAGPLGKRKAAGEGGEAQGAEAGEEETRHAVLEYVVKGLDEALLTELLEGFHL